MESRESMNGFSLRDVLSDAVWYWEPRRAVFNGALVTVVLLACAIVFLVATALFLPAYGD